MIFHFDIPVSFNSVIDQNTFTWSVRLAPFVQSSVCATSQKTPEDHLASPEPVDNRTQAIIQSPAESAFDCEKVSS